LLAGCGGGGGSSSGAAAPATGTGDTGGTGGTGDTGDTGGTGGTGGTGLPDTGTLDPGSAGVSITQIDDGAGALVTASFLAAVDVNDTLEVVGYAAATAGSPFAAALWTVDASDPLTLALVPVPLAPLVDNGFAAAFAIDEAGSSVGQAADGSRLVAVVWDNLGTPTVLPQLAATGDYAAYAISADGTLVAGVAVGNTGRTRAVLWTAEGSGNFLAAPLELPVNIFASGTALSPFSAANGIARVGAGEILVVGEAETGNGALHAALWRSTNGGATFSPIDLGADHIAYAVNGSRQVVGESDAVLAPVVWSVSDQGVASAPVSLAAAGSAVAVNENGLIAGWSGTPTDLATVWEGATPTTLFTTVSQAYGMNNETQPLVVGRSGDQGFVTRVE
jgi:uncharacterized membrane protein